jgi:hypothetical protein
MVVREKTQFLINMLSHQDFIDKRNLPLNSSSLGYEDRTDIFCDFELFLDSLSKCEKAQNYFSKS